MKLTAVVSIQSVMKLSELNRLVGIGSPDVPASVRISPKRSLEWKGTAWLRSVPEYTDVLIIEG